MATMYSTTRPLMLMSLVKSNEYHIGLGLGEAHLDIYLVALRSLRWQSALGAPHDLRRVWTVVPNPAGKQVVCTSPTK